MAQRGTVASMGRFDTKLDFVLRAARRADVHTLELHNGMIFPDLDNRRSRAGQQHMGMGAAASTAGAAERTSNHRRSARRAANDVVPCKAVLIFPRISTAPVSSALFYILVT